MDGEPISYSLPICWPPDGVCWLEGRKAKADGKAINASHYTPGTVADAQWIAGYRGEPCPE